MQTLSVFKNNHGDEDRYDGDDDSDDACLKIRMKILPGVAGLWCRP